MRIWFAVVSLAVVAVMCIALIVTTIMTMIMCPGYANPFIDTVVCVIAGIFAVGILITIWNLIRIKKHFKEVSKLW